MSRSPHEWDEIVKTLIAQADIPVPETEARKLGEMFAGAEDARRKLRSASLGETEPMIVFSSERSERHHER